MLLIIALLPIFFIFIFLFVLKFTSLRASVLTFALTILITLLFQPYYLSIDEMVFASTHGVLISFIAAYVLFFGIFLFHLIDHIGGIDSIASFISNATDDRIVQVLILVVGLSPLIESTSGFGIAFMMIAPIFAAIGFSKMKAALLGLISLLAVPWGALATGTIIGAELGGISLKQFGFGTALVSMPVFAYFILSTVVIAGGWGAVKKKWKEILVIYVTFTGTILLFNSFVSVELAGVLSSLIVIGIGFFMIRRPKKNVKRTESNLHILKVFSPYMILTGLIFSTRLDTPFKDFLETHAVIRLPDFSYELALLYSPAFWLFVTCVISIMIFKVNKRDMLTLLHKTIKQWIPFLITTSCFVSISELMSVAGMVTTISQTAGDVFGHSFIIVSTIIGAIGGFLTGSTTSSNAMFIKLQMQTAEQIGLPLEIVAYSQNASASHATMASPARVMLGSSLLGIKSQETEILKKISLIVGAALVLIVLMTGGIYFLM